MTVRGRGKRNQKQTARERRKIRPGNEMKRERVCRKPKERIKQLN